MKYHSLPSLSDLKAYRNGKLSNDERSWIDTVINNNPMVAEVFKNIENTNTTAVQRVSESVSNKISKTYIPSTGFWSKYAGWISLSSIVLILWGVYFFNQDNVKSQYLAEQTSLNINSPENSEGVNLVSSENNKNENVERSEADQFLESSDSESVKKEERLDVDLDIKKSTKIESKEGKNVESLKTLAFEEDKVNEESANINKKQPNNIRGFTKNESNEKTGSVLLAVNSVHILSKLNPDDFNTRKTTSNRNDPLGRGDTKRQGNASYAMGDLPSYPGGDQALINYFKGQLRPIEIPAAADKFDRSVMIELEVSSRGKLKDHKIYGNLHPSHQKQLEKAIEELPHFEKGRGEKVKYSLAISF